MADLTSTDGNEKWLAGSTIESILFVVSDTYDDAEEVAKNKIQEFGWEITNIKKLSNIPSESVNKMDALMKEAFENACLYGFGVVTYSEENCIEKNT